MKVHLSTGGYQDYIELMPETMQEVQDLAMVAMSKFIAEDKIFCDFSGAGLGVSMKMRIFVSEKRPHDPNSADALDSTP